MAPTPETLTLNTPEVTLAALAWGPARGPLALCLHGFPDTAWTWRRVAPRLAAAGWRVVAPFLRGYAPSGLAPSGHYSAAAYAQDAVALHGTLGGDGRALLIGHDWGAVATYLVAGAPTQPFSRAVTLSIPPPWSTLTPRSLASDPAAATRQLALSSYMAYLAISGGLGDRSLARVIPWLWRWWSPGYDAGGDLPAVLAALGTPEHARAARLPYRALLRPDRELGARSRALREESRLPLLYLHGERDRCMHAGFARLGARSLPPGRFALLPNAGHFLALEAPEAVARRILEFVESDV